MRSAGLLLCIFIIIDLYGGSLVPISKSDRFIVNAFRLTNPETTTITLSQDMLVDVLLVGGGGAGGDDCGGGGGAGAVAFYQQYLFQAGTYEVTVGAGQTRSGDDGGSSSITQDGVVILIAVGGRGGRSGCTNGEADCNGDGGDGAGGKGQMGNADAPGNGGDGIYSKSGVDFADFFGSAYTEMANYDGIHPGFYIAGGGGGGSSGNQTDSNAAGGMGGGGYGSALAKDQNPQGGTEAMPNTGSGGGGGSCNYGNGGSGADGLVIFRYTECTSPLCTAGMYVSDTNGSCKSCGAGKYSSIIGSSACALCDIGTYSSSSDLGSSQCLGCPAGSYSSAIGLAACVLCDAGKYSNLGDCSACVPTYFSASPITFMPEPPEMITIGVSNGFSMNALRFTTPGTIQIFIGQDMLVDVLLVGGGGAGGNDCGGGGGAGAVVFYPQYLFRMGTYEVTLGAGQTTSGRDGGNSSIENVNDGGRSVLFRAVGGGGGAAKTRGDAGGSSGGGSPFYKGNPAMYSSDNVVAGVSGVSPQSSRYVAGGIGGSGKPGCASDNATCNGGGGGGAGGNGQPGNYSAPGKGGDGIYTMLGYDFADYFGRAYTEVAISEGGHYYIAGGGGGGGWGKPTGKSVSGGMGGGGNGSEVPASGLREDGRNASRNTGSGGGGGSCNLANGGSGAEGFVILKFTVCIPCNAGFIPTNSRCIECDLGKYASKPGSSNCLTCGKGTYTSGPGSGRCLDCKSGNQSSANSTSCTLCGVGTYSSSKNGSSAGSTLCLNCTAGSYSSISGSSTCSICSAGTYSSDSSSQCLMCKAGSYSSTLGSSACALCGMGTFLNRSSAGSTQCLVCKAGSYSSTSGSSDCALCSAGTFSNGSSAGSLQCRICPAGSYSSTSGSSSCASCRAGTFSNISSANTSAACIVCSAGTYSSLNGSMKCSDCNSSLCDLGQFRLPCLSGAVSNSDCTPCISALPANAQYTSPSNDQYTRLPYISRIAYMVKRCDSWLCSLGYSRTLLSSNMGYYCSPCSAKPPAFASFVPLDSNSSSNFAISSPVNGYDDPTTCSWACNPGFVLNNAGICVRTTCASSQYLSNVSGKCLPCNTAVCSLTQYKKPCTADSDAACLNCSTCDVGKYLIGCQSGRDQTCLDCSNKYEICGAINGSISMYTSPGVLQSNCLWKCIDGYYRSGDMCRLCTTTSCGVGLYRAACAPNADAPCVPCSGLQDHAAFFTAGAPYNVDNCQWACIDSYYLQQTGNSSKCVACLQPSSCAKGMYIAQCTRTENYKCVACPTILHADFIRAGACDFKCTSGFYRNGTQCVPCSQNVTCSGGQSLIECTADHDVLCTICSPGLQYELRDSGSGVNSIQCVPCDRTQCNQTGTYRTICPATTDSQCIACTQGVLHSYYTSAGSLGMDNCSWDCNPGFERKFDNIENSYLCLPCQAGSYSLLGDNQCRSCPAGTYSGLTGVSTADACEKCQQGTYSTIEQATSSRVCLDCEVGTYQETEGQSSCNPCPKDTYGTTTAATSQSQCLACRTLDTSTRQAVGQKFKTACICNPNYYRINNATDQCQKCPPGLVCNGYDFVVPVVNQSVWNITHIGENDYYRLLFCPRGYYYQELFSFNPRDPNAVGILSAQQCTSCDAGTECTQPPCLSCSKCKPGRFKSCPGPTDCVECKADTYEPRNGSLTCLQCPKGTTTNGYSGSDSETQCVCDTKNYDLGQGCQTCPAGLTCFGNSTAIPILLDVGEPIWKIDVDTDGIQKYNLTFCPQGYFIAGSISLPGQMQCVACSAGYECVTPPCYGACFKCNPGFWKSSSILYPDYVPRSHFDQIEGQYTRPWIEEPCSSCPVNTYRSFSGGTEIGSCSTCPPKATTGGLLNRTSIADCRCDIFYYAQATSQTSALTCTDCPQGGVCASDRSCTFGRLPRETFTIGDRQANLSCNDPIDLIFGGWIRNSTGEYRLEYCPPGYILQRSEFTATADKCIECPTNTYSLEIVYSPSVQCKPCPIGASCPGGDKVIPDPGYWQMPTARRDGGIAGKAVVYQCPPGVCDAGGTCLYNRTGPVCGLCPPGWAFVAKGCNPCPPEDQLSPLRKIVIAIFVLVCLMIWYVASWKPVLFADTSADLEGSFKKLKQTKGKVEGQMKKLEKKVKDGMKSIQSLPDKIAQMKEKILNSIGGDMQDQLEGLTRERIGHYLKLYVSYFQVVSSFLTFSVKWPDLLRNSMTWIKGTLFLDVLQLPGLACLWTGINFQQRLMTYTLGPLVVIFCLALPCIFAWFAGYQKTKPRHWEAAADAAWKNIMFWLFLVYPNVSLTTLQAFDCRPAGLGLLAADLNLKCPKSSDLLSVWSIVFIFVYPIGIPLFCMISMLGMGVHLIAQDKINTNILSSMVAKYMQVTTSIESHRIAGLFHSEDQTVEEEQASPEVESFLNSYKSKSLKEYYNLDDLSQAQFQGLDVITICKLIQMRFKDDPQNISAPNFVRLLDHEKRVRLVYHLFFDEDGNLKPEESLGTMNLSGVDHASMKRFIVKYDKNGDQLISLDEFREMVDEVIFDTTLFTGVEHDRLTNAQAVALLTFDWKSIIPKPMKAGAGNGAKTVKDGSKHSEGRSQKDSKSSPAPGSNVPRTDSQKQDKSVAVGVLMYKTDESKSGVLQSAQGTFKSAKETVDKGQKAVDTGKKAVDTGKKALETGKTVLNTGQKVLKVGGSAVKHASRCCSHDGSDPEDDDNDGDNLENERKSNSIEVDKGDEGDDSEKQSKKAKDGENDKEETGRGEDEKSDLQNPKEPELKKASTKEGHDKDKAEIQAQHLQKDIPAVHPSQQDKCAVTAPKPPGEVAAAGVLEQHGQGNINKSHKKNPASTGDGQEIQLETNSGKASTQEENKAKTAQTAMKKAQDTFKSAKEVADKGQKAVDTGKKAVEAGKKAVETGKTVLNTGQKVLKVGGSAVKHASRCCSHDAGDDDDDDENKDTDEQDNKDKNENDGDGDEKGGGGEGKDSNTKKVGGGAKKGEGKEKETKTVKDVWKDKAWLEKACTKYKDKVAAEIWKLGTNLLKSKVISVPDVVWAQGRNLGAVTNQSEIDDSSLKKLQDTFVIHPDIHDDYRQENLFSKFLRLVSTFSLQIPDSWKSVNKRRALEAKAVHRVGFVFAAYKVNYWFWEMIEMTRKFLMTSFLVVVLYPGQPSQLAAGLIISLIFMILSLGFNPLATEGLNQTQTSALLSNLLTLFVGIMLIITADLEAAAIRAGETFDSRERDIISSVIFIANMLVMAVPAWKTLADGRVLDRIFDKIKDQFCNDEQKAMLAEFSDLRSTVASEVAEISDIAGEASGALNDATGLLSSLPSPKPGGPSGSEGGGPTPPIPAAPATLLGLESAAGPGSEAAGSGPLEAQAVSQLPRLTRRQVEDHLSPADFKSWA